MCWISKKWTRCAVSWTAHTYTRVHKHSQANSWKIVSQNTAGKWWRSSERKRERENKKKKCHTNQHEMCSQEMPKSSTISFRRKFHTLQQHCVVFAALTHSFSLFHFLWKIFFCAFGLPFCADDLQREIFPQETFYTWGWNWEDEKKRKYKCKHKRDEKKKWRNEEEKSSRYLCYEAHSHTATCR